ncbi:MAG: Dam family site-specific DNA-(adenine-N6)-methyltransferase [Methanophagales archaeon]|nr:Dam family site-specific DNA-(adenine-N6)-methyltransferase [Methanophagales archaeon]
MKVKPFLKWAGGKTKLIYHLLDFVPENFNNYFEPFLGGGSLYFALKPKKAYLSDINEELINTYAQVKNNVETLMFHLRGMKYNKNFYYKIRSKDIKDEIHKAAKFIYLNKTCWNGLYRVNSKGEFNVPFGKFKNPRIYDEENLNNISKLLKHAEIRVADFQDIVAMASRDDFIYFDPPFVTSANNNRFIKYSSRIFSIEDQFRLKEVMEELSNKGCKIVVSNADHWIIKEYFKDFNINRVERKSLIAADKRKRRTITELIITNF